MVAFLGVSVETSLPDHSMGPVRSSGSEATGCRDVSLSEYHKKDDEHHRTARLGTGIWHPTPIKSNRCWDPQWQARDHLD